MRVCMFDTTTGFAFGPVIDGPDAMSRLETFLEALPDDPRVFPDHALERYWTAFVLAMAEAEDTEPGSEPTVPVDPGEANAVAFVEAARAAGYGETKIAGWLEDHADAIRFGGTDAFTMLTGQKVPAVPTPATSPEIPPEPEPADTDRDARSVPPQPPGPDSRMTAGHIQCWECGGSGQRWGGAPGERCEGCHGTGTRPAP